MIDNQAFILEYLSTLSILSTLSTLGILNTLSTSSTLFPKLLSTPQVVLACLFHLQKFL